MKKKQNSSTLSVCLIVKNEEKHLSDCLDSINDIADQIIVVDTGSTDNTKNIAESYGAEIYNFSWCDDFSAARNESIKYANGDWILWIDADEQLMPESKAGLMAHIHHEDEPVIYRIGIRNIKPDGNSYVLSTAHRLFTNHRGIQFSGRIHEQISYSAQAIKAEERISPATLYHIGYSYSGEKKRQKLERNFTILSQMLKDEPDNAYVHLTLGHNMKERGLMGDARKQYEVALKLDQFDSSMKSTLLNSLADIFIESNELTRAVRFIEHSQKLSPRQNVGYYLDYRAANKIGDYAKAIKSLEILLEMIPLVNEMGSQLSTDIDFDLIRVHFSLGNLYFAEKRWDLARNLYEKVISEKPNDPDTLKRLVKVCHYSQDFVMAEFYLEQLMQLQEENADYLAILGILSIKQQKFTKAITVYEKLMRIQPERQEYGRCLAGLYAKTGDVERMQQLL